jgi:hypothetical protein
MVANHGHSSNGLILRRQKHPEWRHGDACSSTNSVGHLPQSRTAPSISCEPMRIAMEAGHRPTCLVILLGPVFDRQSQREKVPGDGACGQGVPNRTGAG